jgi:hypothetical protein
MLFVALLVQQVFSQSVQQCAYPSIANCVSGYICPFPSTAITAQGSGAGSTGSTQAKVVQWCRFAEAGANTGFSLGTRFWGGTSVTYYSYGAYVPLVISTTPTSGSPPLPNPLSSTLQTFTGYIDGGSNNGGIATGIPPGANFANVTVLPFSTNTYPSGSTPTSGLTYTIGPGVVGNPGTQAAPPFGPPVFAQYNSTCLTYGYQGSSVGNAFYNASTGASRGIDGAGTAGNSQFQVASAACGDDVFGTPNPTICQACAA